MLYLDDEFLIIKLFLGCKFVLLEICLVFIDLVVDKYFLWFVLVLKYFILILGVNYILLLLILVNVFVVLRVVFVWLGELVVVKFFLSWGC